MKAITYQVDTDRFRSSLIPEPELETPFDVVIQVNAVGLNPVDAKINYWFGMVDTHQRPFVGGLDVSGTIVKTGSSVTHWQVGDNVLYHGNMRRCQGGFAQYAIHDSRTLIPHPDVDAITAAASPCAGWTAYRALNKLSIAERSNVLIHGATGGVGSYAIQLCRHVGVATIIATCSDKNRDYARQLGATHALDYHDPDWETQILNITGDDKLDGAVDCVGGDQEARLSELLGFDGQLVEVVNTIDSACHHNAFSRGLSLHQVSLGSGHIFGMKGVASLITAGSTVSRLLEQGAIHSPRLTPVSLDDIPDALYAMRKKHTCGKFVALINE